MNGRTLVLCFDGTTNKFDRTNTNIVRLFSLLKKDEHDKQLVYYQAGIGTYSAPGIWNSVARKVSQWADMATAWFLPEHVMSGYEFLMQNYKYGDKICLFGFSRGAYTCRALAGFLYKCGLLPKGNHEQITFAYSMYVQPDLNHAFDFRDTFCRTVEIEFMGVWDTVSSVGLLIPKHLPFTQSTHIIRTFRQALALDERRAKFQPNLWHIPAPNVRQASRDPEMGSGVKGQSSPRPFMKRKLRDEPAELLRHISHSSTKEKDKGVSTIVEDKRPPSNVQEVWFAGCHADVGGGSVADTEMHALSSISLRWMIKECAAAQSGILFDTAALKHAGIPVSTFRSAGAFGNFAPSPSLRRALAQRSSPQRSSRMLHDELPSADQVLQPTPSPKPKSKAISEPATPQPPPAPAVPGGSENHLGLKLGSGSHHVEPTTTVTVVEPDNGRPSMESHTSDDHWRMTAQELDDEEAGAPMYDQVKKISWGIMEFLPFFHTYQDEQGNWPKVLRINFFRSRKIRSPRPLFHTSVKTRMEKHGYTPAARWQGDPVFVH